MSEEKRRDIAVRRAKNYEERHPEKRAAQHAAGNAIRDGRILRQPCEVCGAAERVQAHHDDYGQPLAVRWLCVTHHNEHHKAERRQRWAAQEQKA